MRKELQMFAQCMEHKLKLNDHKGGWENSSNAQLFSFLRREVDELEQAMAGEPNLAVMFEAADIANFAMMIAWNAARDMVAASVQPARPDAPEHHDFNTNPRCPWNKDGYCDCIPF